MSSQAGKWKGQSRCQEKEICRWLIEGCFFGEVYWQDDSSGGSAGINQPTKLFFLQHNTTFSPSDVGMVNQCMEMGQIGWMMVLSLTFGGWKVELKQILSTASWDHGTTIKQLSSQLRSDPAILSTQPQISKWSKFSWKQKVSLKTMPSFLPAVLLLFYFKCFNSFLRTKTLEQVNGVWNVLKSLHSSLWIKLQFHSSLLSLSIPSFRSTSYALM